MDGIKLNKAAGLVLKNKNILLQLLGFFGDEFLIEWCVGVAGGGGRILSHAIRLAGIAAVVGLRNEGGQGIIVFTRYLSLRVLLRCHL